MRSLVSVGGIIIFIICCLCKNIHAFYWESDYVLHFLRDKAKPQDCFFLIDFNTKGRKEYYFWQYKSSLLLQPQNLNKKISINPGYLNIYNQLYDVKIGDISGVLDGQARLDGTGKKGVEINFKDKYYAFITHDLSQFGASARWHKQGKYINTSFNISFLNKPWLIDYMYKMDININISRFNLVLSTGFSNNKFIKSLSAQYILWQINKDNIKGNSIVSYDNHKFRSITNLSGRVGNLMSYGINTTLPEKKTDMYLELKDGSGMIDSSCNLSIYRNKKNMRLSHKSKTKDITLGGSFSQRDKDYHEQQGGYTSKNSYISYSKKLSDRLSCNYSYSSTDSDFVSSDKAQNKLDYEYGQNVHNLGMNYKVWFLPMNLSCSVSKTDSDSRFGKSSPKDVTTYSKSFGLNYYSGIFSLSANYNFRDSFYKGYGQHIRSDYSLVRSSWNLTDNLKLYILKFNSNHDNYTKYTFYQRPTKDMPLSMKLNIDTKRGEKKKWELLTEYEEGIKKETTKITPQLIEYKREDKIKSGMFPSHLATLSEEKIPTKDILKNLVKMNILVFEDKDADTVLDKDTDRGIEDIKIKLKKQTTEPDVLQAQVITNKSGRAAFLDLPSGSYTVSLDISELPLDLACILPKERTIYIDPSVTQEIVIKFPISKTGSIRGKVFIDKNRNGRLDSTEYGYPNILVYVNNEKIASSNSRGDYRFGNIAAGDVVVEIKQEDLPAGYEFTTPSKYKIKLSPQEIIKDINFGIAKKEKEIEFM